MKKQSMAEISSNATKSTKKFFADFKAFITRGNVLDMAVGVIIGGAFNTIVTALVNILLSLCTWGVPGGIKGLVTVLPAANSAQAGLAGVGQSFASGSINDVALQQAISKGLVAAGSSAADNPTVIQNEVNSLKSLYKLHGSSYYYNASAIIDWGTFINAIISFIIIGFTLFIVVRTIKSLDARRQAIADKLKADEGEAEASPAPAPVPAPTEMDVLVEIRDELKKLNVDKPAAETK